MDFPSKAMSLHLYQLPQSTTLKLLMLVDVIAKALIIE